MTSFQGFQALHFEAQAIFRGPRKTKIYKEVIELASSPNHLPESRDVIDLDKRSAQKVLEIIGWNLIQKDYLTEEELIDKVVHELKILGYSLEVSEAKTDKGICFWKDKQILSHSTFARESRIEYSHFSLCEYSAAQYVSRLNETDFRDWLLEAKEDFRWHSVILFASGLGMGEKIVSLLMESYGSENSAISVLKLATEAAKEHKNISLDVLKELTDKILPSLDSEYFSTVLEGVNALLNILPAASEYINEVVKALLESNKFSTRIAAARLAVACKTKDIDLEKIYQIVQEILGDPVQLDSNFPVLTTPNGEQFSLTETDSNKRICKPAEWIIRDDILLYGFQLLLEYRGGVDIANQTWAVISEDHLGFDNKNILEKSLVIHIQENLKTEENKKDVDSYKILHSKIRQNTYEKIIDFDKKSLSGGFLSAEPNLKRLKEIRKDRAADLVFLESILRVTQNSQEEFHVSNTSNHEELVSLGILFKGMGWWGIAHNQWTQLQESTDYNAIDVILNGMITVLDINKNKLRGEVLKVFRDIKSFFDLDLVKIERLLEIESNSSKEITNAFHHLAIRYLREEVYQNRAFFLGLASQIPKVPIEFQWELTDNINLSAQALISAIQHPSLGISQNAALLIKYGAGGEEAIKLVKELAGEDEWKAFEKTLPDIWKERYGD